MNRRLTVRPAARVVQSKCSTNSSRNSPMDLKIPKDTKHTPVLTRRITQRHGPTGGAPIVVYSGPGRRGSFAPEVYAVILLISTGSLCWNQWSFSVVCLFLQWDGYRSVSLRFLLWVFIWNFELRPTHKTWCGFPNAVVEVGTVTEQPLVSAHDIYRESAHTRS